MSGEKGQRFVRVDAARLDTLMTLIGELVIARGRLQDIARRSANPALSETVLNASRLIGNLQTEITTARMVPVGQAFGFCTLKVVMAGPSVAMDSLVLLNGSSLPSR